MKFLPVIIVLTALNIYAQNEDTTSADTVKTLPDTLIITEQDTLYTDTTLTVQQYIPPDTLSPVYQKPFYAESFFINKSTIDFLDYRYTGDLFFPSAPAFLKDRGFIGQPNELILYGTSNNAYLDDGVLLNNRYSFLYDLNFVQNENIDSIEVLPLPRGFLYGPEMYSAAVNIISKDFLSPRPYTRIKYYEGPDGEAFVDAIFSSLFYNRFNFHLDVTNRKFDSLFTNSDFSMWQVKAQIKYLLSNSINLIGSYSLVSSDLGLNGGIDADSILNLTNDINSVLYEPLTAPVVNPSLRQETNHNKFRLKALGSFGSFRSDLNLYYNSEKEDYSGIPSDDEINNFIWGASLKQSYMPSPMKLEINSVYESRELKHYFIDTSTGFLRQKYDYSIFSVSPLASLYLLDSVIIPSVFYKYSKNFEDNSSANYGFGADVTLKIFRILKFYFGFSSFDLLNQVKTDVYEFGASVNYNQLFADIRLYSRTNSVSFFELHSNGFIMPVSSPVVTGDIKGLALSLKYDFWKLGLEGKFIFNDFDENRFLPAGEVKTHIAGGVFYKDKLFNNNLKLKTGFAVKYYEFESGRNKSAFQLDFTVAGKIQDAAIVYFSWENLFNKQYYIVPYYPMRERGIRFGLSWELFN
jgi:outer membrane receptor protein involved in Fe transport